MFGYTATFLNISIPARGVILWFALSRFESPVIKPISQRSLRSRFATGMPVVLGTRTTISLLFKHLSEEEAIDSFIIGWLLLVKCYYWYHNWVLPSSFESNMREEFWIVPEFWENKIELVAIMWMATNTSKKKRERKEVKFQKRVKRTARRTNGELH